MNILGTTLNLRSLFCDRINHRMAVTVLVLPLMINGCASVRGYPDRLIDPEIALKEVRPIIKREKIDSCSDKSCRNQILSAEMIGIDINFSEFERKLFKENREVSFLTTFTTLGLTTAGAMTGTAVLAGIATGIIGSKEAFDKEMLLDQAKNAIHTKMRALRQTVANRIRYGMKQSFDEYPLDTALIDIEEYYNAGTLLGAFVGITASAGQQIEESEVNKDRVLLGKEPLSFSPLNSIKVDQIDSQKAVKTSTTEAVLNWLDDDDDNTKFNKLQQWLTEKQILDSTGNVEIPLFFAKSGKYEQKRKLAIEDLKIPQ